MSAIFYAIIADNFREEVRLVTGDLRYKDEYIFKQDFSISEASDSIFQEWSGHAWVELDNTIYDLSLFRTLYSDRFTKPCKQEMINDFGLGRGALIASPCHMENLNLHYYAIDYLPDNIATGVIKGYEQLLKLNSGGK